MFNFLKQSMASGGLAVRRCATLICIVAIAIGGSALAAAQELDWPQGRAIPRFARPAHSLDAIELQSLSDDQRITFSSLQGHVNAVQPRILLLDAKAGEGRDTWPDTASVKLGPRKIYAAEQRYELLKKYRDCVRGIVLYDPARSTHYRNLAGTIAALEQALPVSLQVQQELREHDLDFTVLRDLSKLTMTSGPEIYQYLYDHEWHRCTKRLILSARPGRRGDLDHTRDIATAAGAAVVWLDNRDPNERDLMRKFLADMPAGNAIVLGWYTSERSGITTASEFGLGTLPADYYVSGSVYAGGEPMIQIPPTPRRSPLQNKAYITLFISDGDNIQYNQHAMRQIWDQSQQDRKALPLNWTISPALVDIGPGLMNYYYSTSGPNDCFVTGPSGMGYAMPVNTLREPGASVGVHMVDSKKMEGYTQMTQRYLRRSGLRVVTVWDNLTDEHREIYARNCHDLLGATVQNFRDDPSVRSSVENERTRFERLIIPYCTTSEHLASSIRKELNQWDQTSPLFLAYQVNVWKELKPQRLVSLADQLSQEYDEKIAFVRADHYFNYRLQHDALPSNVTNLATTKIRSLEREVPHLNDLIDGSAATSVALPSGLSLGLELEFDSLQKLDRARIAGEQVDAASIQVMASSDYQNWKELPYPVDQSSNGQFTDWNAAPAKWLRISLTNPSEQAVAVGEIEIFARQATR